MIQLRLGISRNRSPSSHAELRTMLPKEELKKVVLSAGISLDHIVSPEGPRCHGRSPWGDGLQLDTRNISGPSTGVAFGCHQMPDVDINHQETDKL